MRMRRIYFTAICLGLTGGPAIGCSAAEPPADGITELGTVNLPLETFGASGFRYRLHNAVFEVRDKRTARVRATLNSDDEPFSNLISAELDSGDYQVTLLPGWFIEQIGDGDFGPIGPTGPIDIPPGVTPAIPGPPSPVPTPPSVTAVPVASSAPFPIGAPTVAPVPVPTTPPTTTFPDETFEDFTSEPFPPDETFGPTGSTGSTGGGFSRIINAALESNAIQDFTIFPNNSSFVFYTFRVGDNVISFEPGSINVIFDVIEDGVQPPPPPDPCADVAGMKRPSVIETGTDATQFVTLRDAFNAMAANEGFGTDGETIYKQIIDSYASADQARMPDAVHCGDETTNGEPSLNGYRLDCNRQERFQFDNLDLWKQTAFVNRFDLAPESGAHCGQQRMVFANNTQGRMFFILEAQIPNPHPELGIEGCAPLAQFWADQVDIEDAKSRGFRLANAFLNGDPDLQSQGFSPFVKASNYTVGTGQIRTNNFDDAFWTLREFKLATDSGEVKAIPFPVAEAPNGALWNDNVETDQGDFCREAFLTSLQGVLVDEPGAMTFVVPQECKDAESRNLFEQDYPSQMSQGSGALIDQIDSVVAGTGLNAFDIAARAAFSGSCIGCHNESVGRDLGRGVSAPFSLDFVHVGEFTESCPDGSECFATSSGLKETFLPHRLDVLGRVVNVSMPPSCGGGDDPFPGFDAGVGSSAPVDTVGEQTTESGLGSGSFGPALDGGALLVQEVELPAADTPVTELVKQDEEIREQFGHRTIGGQDARVSH